MTTQMTKETENKFDAAVKAANVRPKTKTIIITINDNRELSIKFNSYDPIHDPVTTPEVNRTIAMLRSGHNKYLRAFRMEQRLASQRAGQSEPALKK